MKLAALPPTQSRVVITIHFSSLENSLATVARYIRLLLPSSSALQKQATITMTAEGLEQWDLTSKISPFLDRHMLFPLLEYLDGLINAGTISYSSKDVAASRLALLRPTHMVDYAIDIYKSVHGESSQVPQEMEDQKAQVFKQLEELKSGCKPLADLCENAEEKVSPKRESSVCCRKLIIS